MTDKAVVGVDIASGRELWQLAFPDELNENIVTPVIAGDVLVISGTRKGTFGYRLEKTATGWGLKQLWHNTDLPMYMSSPVADGSLPLWLRQQAQGPVVLPRREHGHGEVDDRGTRRHQRRDSERRSHLVVLTTDGDLIVPNRNPEKYEEVRRYKVATSPTWAQPVVLNSALVVRDADSVAVWSLK